MSMGVAQGELPEQLQMSISDVLFAIQAHTCKALVGVAVAPGTEWGLSSCPRQAGQRAANFLYQQC